MPNFPVIRLRLHSMGISLIMLVSFFGAFTLAWQGISAEISAREKLATALKLTHHAMELKFLAADFNGWQTAYAFDVTRNTPDATNDNSGTRGKFLASAKSFSDKLQDTPVELLTTEESTALKKARVAFEEFMRIDQQVIAAYRQGGAKNIQEANQLVLGREIDTFQEISNIISSLATSIMQRSDQASKDASKASSQSRWLFIGGGIATLPLLFSCMLLVMQSFSRQTRDLSPEIDMD